MQVRAFERYIPLMKFHVVGPDLGANSLQKFTI